MERDVNANGKKKLAFAVFVCTKDECGKNNDSKVIITEIISNRIEEKIDKSKTHGGSNNEKNK